MLMLAACFELLLQKRKIVGCFFLMCYCCLTFLVKCTSGATENDAQKMCLGSPLEHVQTKYCRADFVLKATVKGESTITQTHPGWKALSISIRSQIKISKEFIDLENEDLQEIHVFPDLLANSKLKTGEKYVLSGTLKKFHGKTILAVDLCNDWIQLWSTVGHRHKSALRKAKFDRGCHCKISFIPVLGTGNENFCDLTLRPDAPSLKSATYHDKNTDKLISQCYLKHGHCVKKALSAYRSRCQWSLNGELRGCLSGIR